MVHKRRIAVIVLAVASLFPTGVSADPNWAPASSASIHPGVQTLTNGAQCTANFVFFDSSEVYLGQAAHCSSTSGSTETNGCRAGTLPVGTEVTVTGASRPAIMVYNSWATMQALSESDPNVCQFNDFALLRLHRDDVSKVNPSIPFWGGPVGVNTAGTTQGEQVYSYGNSSLRLGLSQLSPKKGSSLGDSGAGWTHLVSTTTPGVPGDSGSAFLDSRGRALGVLSTINVALPGVVNNGVGDLQRELDYLRAKSALTGVQLALGTAAFNGNRLPLGI